ncbi:uncharacterized protein LY79DRAFT_557498 [Colletotrichum navitas]|uniref:Secreted protein n=1 Tax=Colletotrichum navitas TaxID=681940 RepID=A0AAD8V3H2_9PEZI|nr:uncharacterized protein LY79DRAFT_557498 [Colletotrichum navitas]KAK1585878.1 hypothetical protein LY79DRAFT_557498 [Colletotrichum navitas]
MPFPFILSVLSVSRCVGSFARQTSPPPLPFPPNETPGRFLLEQTSVNIARSGRLDALHPSPPSPDEHLPGAKLPFTAFYLTASFGRHHIHVGGPMLVRRQKPDDKALAVMSREAVVEEIWTACLSAIRSNFLSLSFSHHPVRFLTPEFKTLDKEKVIKKKKQ